MLFGGFQCIFVHRVHDNLVKLSYFSLCWYWFFKMMLEKCFFNNKTTEAHSQNMFCGKILYDKVSLSFGNHWAQHVCHQEGHALGLPKLSQGCHSHTRPMLPCKCTWGLNMPEVTSFPQKCNDFYYNNGMFKQLTHFRIGECPP